MSRINQFGIIILAAGSSSRLGEPKQLLSYQHKSLLQHTIDAAKDTRDGIVVVILGGNHEAVAKEVEGPGLIYNADWEEGMSSSIRTGLSALLEKYTAPEPNDPADIEGTELQAGLQSDETTTSEAQTDLDGVIITVCDQPFLTTAVLEALLDEAKLSGKSIVASAYNGTLGTPVYFGRQHFDDLLALKGQEGAKMLLKKYEAQVASVPFEKGEIDIDTFEDYQKLISS
ncbi:molybdenum cofactor cytidylyltransferase [Pedobacter westerhofensis]|uniref:Molybdenum cofactor cytidylyltransferase n=1 Tax=Pedobacter westerhofensis TaxID=425512 RepID=A0A521CCH7_9SPHI|nr:nucleotidyltransferase family protein [Pedobacter westerhofensis]SMO56501.1 molybdenum cofactor cytidylyltransferase [Pedobacter westerhofensis]